MSKSISDMTYKYINPETDKPTKVPPAHYEKILDQVTEKYMADITSRQFLTIMYNQLNGLKKEEQEAISDIVFILKEMFNEDKTPASLTTVKYFYHFLQAMSNTKELKYILAYVSKAAGYTKPLEFTYNEDQQYVFESIQYSAMTLYSNGGASRTKLAESHKRWEAELSRKNEEKLSRTQELNTAKVMALKELGYTEINEKNASEVFNKIAEIQSRNLY